MIPQISGRSLQLRRKPLPPLSFRHSGPPKNPALPDSVALVEIPGQRRLTAKFNRFQKLATSCKRCNRTMRSVLKILS
jgi:hypothetical protein